MGPHYQISWNKINKEVVRIRFSKELKAVKPNNTDIEEISLLIEDILKSFNKENSDSTRRIKEY